MSVNNGLVSSDRCSVDPSSLTLFSLSLFLMDLLVLRYYTGPAPSQGGSCWTRRQLVTCLTEDKNLPFWLCPDKWRHH